MRQQLGDLRRSALALDDAPGLCRDAGIARLDQRLRRKPPRKRGIARRQPIVCRMRLQRRRLHELERIMAISY